MKTLTLPSLRSIGAGAAVMAIAAALIAGTASAAGNYAFAPPVGWSRVRSGEEPKWLDRTRAQSVKLFSTLFGGDLNSFVAYQLRKERRANPTQRVWTNRNYAICGRHTGRYVIWTASSGGSSVIFEQMMALWGYDGYVVTYVRPATVRPSDAARGSLLSICGVGSVPEQPGGVPVAAPSNGQARGQSGQPASPEQPTPNPTGTISHPYMPVIPN